MLHQRVNCSPTTQTWKVQLIGGLNRSYGGCKTINVASKDEMTKAKTTLAIIALTRNAGTGSRARYANEGLATAEQRPL